MANPPTYQPLDTDLCLVGDVQNAFPTEAQFNANTTQLIVSAASDYFAHDLTNRTWLAQTNVTETRNGNDQDRMMFRYRPVWALSAVMINQTPILIVNDQVSSGAIFDEDHVYMRGYSSSLSVVSGSWWAGSLRFLKGIKNVSFTYSCGYNTPGQAANNHTQAGAPTLPANIQNAVVELVGFWIKRHRNLTHLSTGEGPERVAFVKEDVPPQVKMVADRNRTAQYLGLL